MGIEIGGLNGAADPNLTEINTHVKKEAQQLKEREQNVDSKDTYRLSFRQVRARELDARMRESFQHTCCSRRTSLDIFESSNNKANPTPSKSLDEFMSSSVKAMKEVETHNVHPKSRPTVSRAAPFGGMVPSSRSESDGLLLFDMKSTANTGPIIMNDSYENEEGSGCFRENELDSKTKE